ncbi:MAG: sulfate reduction electron transfer complex DsrMKJOP subunit DsrM [Bryobacteraceae bacterium]
MRNVFVALIAVIGIALLAFAASQADGLRRFIAFAVPYGALAIFLIGLSWRVIRWSLSPVPFHIPTVCGQQKSLPWIKAGRLESPYSTPGVIARMGLEILLFRSLFRNTRARLDESPRLIQGEAKWLWLGALAFHWSMLIVVLRHLRFLVEPVPKLAWWLDGVDGFFQVGAPVLYATDIVLLAALLYLLQRRLRDSQVRVISLFTDYFALFLLLGIAVSGVWMRYFSRVDAVAVKQLALSLTVLSPFLPKNLSPLFFTHLALVSALVAYLPFSKLMHAGGIFLSPTRNLANNSRRKRHVNPWNYPVKVHTYEEWEDEFREKMEAAGLPVERR